MITISQIKHSQMKKQCRSIPEWPQMNNLETLHLRHLQSLIHRGRLMNEK